MPIDKRLYTSPGRDQLEGSRPTSVKRGLSGRDGGPIPGSSSVPEEPLGSARRASDGSTILAPSAVTYSSPVAGTFRAAFTPATGATSNELIVYDAVTYERKGRVTGAASPLDVTGLTAGNYRGFVRSIVGDGPGLQAAESTTIAVS